MTANLRRVKCRRKRSRRNEIAFRTTGEQTLEKNRKMEWAVILLIFCGLAAMVLMVARVNLPVAMGLMVVLTLLRADCNIGLAEARRAVIWMRERPSRRCRRTI